MLGVLLLGIGLVACGGNEGGSKAEQACVETPAPIADPKFPAGFPTITGVTWSASQQAGPSQIVNGYSGDTLDDLFHEMKEKFAGGGYSVAKEERDPQDAEVNFTSEKYDGQVRLGEDCRGRRSVVITIRPRA
jgi:hypothetical protein